MSVSQSQFRRAILDADMAIPTGLRDAGNLPAGRRFDVYRNNVAVSLSEALESGFPVIHKLLGDENFKAIAGVFLRQSPPDSPMMMHYGAAFPGFLRGFKPLAHLGYLGDVATLELAMRRSYHAADSVVVDGDVLARVPPEQLEDVRLEIAPSLEVVCSNWPIHDIWIFNMIKGAPKPRATPQDVVITRVDFDPQPHILADGGAHFVTALKAGASLGKATNEAALIAADFDLSNTLTLLLSGHAITTATI